MPLYPGSKIGVIGGGQLGRMLILECRRMGYYSAVIDADSTGPAAQVADSFFFPQQVDDFIKSCDIATCEFEHFDINIVSKIGSAIPVFPSTSVLNVKQSKATEKMYLAKQGFPVPKFQILNESSELKQLLKKGAFVAKLSKGGYDGKGLFILKNEADYEDVKEDLTGEIIVEELVPFVKEISVVCARNIKGHTVFYPVVENVHDRGILLYSLAPASIDEKTEKKAYDIVHELAKSLHIVGLLVVEMFLLESGHLFINEFAPRPHNSGHYTMDACDISQFEMLLRAICGMDLVPPVMLSPCAMLNILGKGLNDIKFDFLFAERGIKLHFYGKKEVQGRRKMGHVNILGRTREEVEEKLKFAINVLYS